MDDATATDSPAIDAFIDRVTGGEAAAAGSSPDAAIEPSAPATSETDRVAPDQPAEVSASSPETPAAAEPVTPVAEPPSAPSTPDPNAARLEALESQLAETAAKAQQFDLFQQRLQESIAQQQRDAAREARVQRIIDSENLPDPQRKAEAARLVQEVEAEREAEARANYAQYQQMIAQQESATEGVAAIGAAAVQAIQNHPTLTDEMKQDLLANIQYYAQYPNPEAQTNAIKRERAIESRAVARAKAEWERNQTQATTQQVQQRIASGVDDTGVGVGSPAAANKNPRSVDEFVDALFA